MQNSFTKSSYKKLLRISENYHQKMYSSVSFLEYILTNSLKINCKKESELLLNFVKNELHQKWFLRISRLFMEISKCNKIALILSRYLYLHCIWNVFPAFLSPQFKSIQTIQIVFPKITFDYVLFLTIYIYFLCFWNVWIIRLSSLSAALQMWHKTILLITRRSKQGLESLYRSRAREPWAIEPQIEVFVTIVIGF